VAGYNGWPQLKIHKAGDPQNYKISQTSFDALPLHVYRQRKYKLLILVYTLKVHQSKLITIQASVTNTFGTRKLKKIMCWSCCKPRLQRTYTCHSGQVPHSAPNSSDTLQLQSTKNTFSIGVFGSRARPAQAHQVR
jgi:hypothetical protein